MNFLPATCLRKFVALLEPANCDEAVSVRGTEVLAGREVGKVGHIPLHVTAILAAQRSALARRNSSANDTVGDDCRVRSQQEIALQHFGPIPDLVGAGTGCGCKTLAGDEARQQPPSGGRCSRRGRSKDSPVVRGSERKDALEERRGTATHDDQAAAQEGRDSESAHDHRSVVQDIFGGDQTEDHGRFLSAECFAHPDRLGPNYIPRGIKDAERGHGWSACRAVSASPHRDLMLQPGVNEGGRSGAEDPQSAGPSGEDRSPAAAGRSG